MNSIIWIIAWRYLWNARAEKSISTMLITCFSGIFIGSFALALIASIMSGFEKVTHEKLRGIHAQIIMRSYGNELNAAKISALLESEFPEITAYSPINYKQVILQKDAHDDLSNAILLKIIDPILEQKTSSIGTKIIVPTSDQSLQNILTNNTIILGDKLAHNLGVHEGDSINLLFIPTDQNKNNKPTLEQVSVQISGIFSTGIEEFDSGLALMAFSTAQNIFGNIGVMQLSINLNPSASEQTIMQKLKSRFGLEVISWKDLYPALVSALTLEKYVMFFILALIVLVACMNILSLMYMQIIKKRPDIAIYKAMGMRNSAIIILFMGMGISLACIATCCGLIIAACIGFLLQKYPFITLPDSYYVSHLPIHLEWHTFALIFALVLIMSIIATLIPCSTIRFLNIAKILRFEG